MAPRDFHFIFNPFREGDINRAFGIAPRSTIARSPQFSRELSPSGINAADILLHMYRAHDSAEGEITLEQGARILVDLAADARASVTAQVTQAAAAVAEAASSSSLLSSPPPSPDLQANRRFANLRLLHMLARFLLESVGSNVENETDDSSNAGGVNIAANEGASEDCHEGGEVMNVDEIPTEMRHDAEEDQPQRQQQSSISGSSSYGDADNEEDVGMSIKEEDEDVNMEDIPAVEDTIAGSLGMEMTGLERSVVSQREVDAENFSCGGSPVASIEWDRPQTRQEMLATFERMGREFAARLLDESDDETIVESDDETVVETDGAYDADLSDNDEDDTGGVGGPLIFFPTASLRAARELRHVSASSAVTTTISAGRRMWAPNGVSYLYHTVNSRNYRTSGSNFTIYEDASGAANHGLSSAASDRANFLLIGRDYPQENVSTPTLSLEEGMIDNF